MWSLYRVFNALYRAPLPHTSGPYPITAGDHPRIPAPSRPLTAGTERSVLGQPGSASSVLFVNQLGGRTAIIVPVPEAEPMVRSWRQDHDNSAQHGVPAHITLLFPFRHTAALDEALPDLADITSTFRRRPFRLTHVGVFPSVTWLAPEPASLFRDMTRDLVDRFPDCQPYGGAFAEPTPHLTVIDHTRSRDASPTAHRDFLELADRSLPIDATLAEVRLIMEADDGNWSTHTAFPLTS